MVDPVGSPGPFVPPPSSTPPPAAGDHPAPQSVGGFEPDPTGKGKGRPPGPPGQSAKEMLGEVPQGFALGALVSLIAQGQIEEAEALVAELNDDEGDGGGEGATTTTGNTTGSATPVEEDGEAGDDAPVGTLLDGANTADQGGDGNALIDILFDSQQTEENG